MWLPVLLVSNGKGQAVFIPRQHLGEAIADLKGLSSGLSSLLPPSAFSPGCRYPPPRSQVHIPDPDRLLSPQRPLLMFCFTSSTLPFHLNNFCRMDFEGDKEIKAVVLNFRMSMRYIGNLLRTEDSDKHFQHKSDN